MKPEFETLPDLLGEIEHELRARSAVRGTPGRRHAPRRPMVGLALAAACALALTVLPGTISRETGVAYGQIPLLDAKPEPVPERFRDGLMTKLMGGGGPLAEAWTFAAPHGTGYLLRGPGRWCLAIPVTDSGPERGQMGMSCVTTLRYGLAVHLTSSFVAAVPNGVPTPKVHHADGTTTSLRPNAEGIVAVDALEPGATVTFHGTDGTSITSPPAEPEG